jgi:hypothetical protein
MKKETTKEMDGIQILDDIQLEQVSGGVKRRLIKLRRPRGCRPKKKHT